MNRQRKTGRRSRISRQRKTEAKMDKPAEKNRQAKPGEQAWKK